ncbi:MAG: FISUMP domain-containing protein [Flavobacteriales bacterium]
MMLSSIFCRGQAGRAVAAVALFVAIACMHPSGAWAQSINYPYNPDSDTDQNIGTPDLLSLLSVFGTEFLPDPIAIDSLTLEEYLELLQENIAAANDALNAIPGPDCDPCEGLSEVVFGTTTYPVVPIGCECWFAKNLDTYVFANGDVIPALDDVDPANEDTWQSWANNNPIDGARFGRMYSLGARTDARKICPSGWKVPDYSDALAVQNVIGFTQSGSGVGKLLYAVDPVTGIDYLQNVDCTNDFGFNGHPVGYMSDDGGISGFNGSAVWGTQSGSWAGGSSIAQSSYPGEYAFPVRCVKFQSNDRGCMDANFLEFNPNAEYEDGTCLTPVVRGCTDPAANNFDPLANTDVGSCTFGLQQPACNFQDTYTYHGHVYDLVEVGGECWFKQNLRTGHFSNGDPIATWTSDLSDPELPWQALNPVNVDLGDADAFGRLYNQAAALDARNVCPSDWHPSSSSDWDALAQHFGGFMTLMPSIASLGASSDASGYWDYAYMQSNLSGLHVHPAGYITVNENSINGVGTYTAFFESEGSMIWGYLAGSDLSLSRYDLTSFLDWLTSPNFMGASIRCVKD